MSNRWMTAALLFALWPSMAAAQEKPAPDPQPTPEPAAAQPREAGVPLKVSVVISRFRGEKRIGSLTYVLGLVTNGPRTTLRMGSDVPIVQNVISPAGAVQQQSYSYRSIGTNIDCQASTASNGLYRLQVTVADSSVHLDPADKAAVPARASDVPMFRTFNSSFSILLRDGQTTEYTSATDPVTGEVMKIEVGLSVLK
jgi:hypothetical protein